MNTQLNNNYGNVPMGQGNSQWPNPPAGSMPFSDPAQPPVQASPPSGYPGGAYGGAGYGGNGGNMPPAGPPASPPSGGDPDGSKRRRTIGWIIAVALLNLLLLLLWLLLPSRCTCDRHGHNYDDSELVSSDDDRSDDSYFDTIPDDPDRVTPNDSVADEVEDVIEQGGQLQFTISWERGDQVDIDAHCYEPGYHIYFSNKRELSPSGGVLDIDNQERDSGRVEHITYANCSSMHNGNYTFTVMNYSGGNNRGIKAYLTVNGKTYQYSISSLTGREQEVKVARVTVADGRVTNVEHFLSASEVDIHP